MTQIRLARSFRLLFCLALFAAFSLSLVTTTPAHAASFNVTTTLDGADINPGDGICRSTFGSRCTLRAAIQEANALSGIDTINVPAGTFILTRSGFDDTAVNGDLDINSTLIINGAGQNTTIIDGNDLDRVFHITGNFKVAMTNLTIQDGNQTGTGLGGGGIANFGGKLFLTGVTLASNQAFESGGGLSNTGTAILNAVTVSENSASGGGGISNNGTLNITQSSVSNNSTTTATGGGLVNAFGTVTMTFTTVAHNASSTGGGITTLGGLFKIENSTINGNTSTSQGAGIDITLNAQVDVVNSTISGNHGGSFGGGIYVVTGMATFASVTITENSEVGIRNNSGTVKLKNTILGGNLGSSDCLGTLESFAYNLIQTPDCTIIGDITGNVIGLDPALFPLALSSCTYGEPGTTMTHCLNALGPARDTANPAGCTDFNGVLISQDQHGPGLFHDRHFGLCDIGSVEFQVDL